MLFTSNRTAGQDGRGGLAIFMATSANGINFTAPQPILTNVNPSHPFNNVCDLSTRDQFILVANGM
jgi:hypothetical protein